MARSLAFSSSRIICLIYARMATSIKSERFLNWSDRLSMASRRSSESVIDVLTFILQIYSHLYCVSICTQSFLGLIQQPEDHSQYHYAPKGHVSSSKLWDHRLPDRVVVNRTDLSKIHIICL